MQSNYPADKRYPRFTFIQQYLPGKRITSEGLHPSGTPWH